MGLRIDERELLLHSGVGEQIATLLGQAIEQHKDTGRGASVVLAITVRTDAKTGKTHARGQVKATIPDGDNNMTVTKLPSQGLLTISNDHPGQQTLNDLAKPTPAKRLKQAKASIRKEKKPKTLFDTMDCVEECAVVSSTWKRMRELPGCAHLPEVKCRILTALYHYCQNKNPGEKDPQLSVMHRAVLAKHIGCQIDVHAGQLAAMGKIDRCEQDFQIAQDTYCAIDAIIRSMAAEAG